MRHTSSLPCRGTAVVALAAALSLAPAPKAAAIFGVGDIVYDPAAFAQMAESIVNQVYEIAQKAEDLTTQYAQMQNQAQQIQLQIRSLQDLDFSSWQAASNSLQSLRGRWGAVAYSIRIQEGITEDWFNQVFPGVHADVVAAQHIQEHELQMAFKREAERDAARASALVVEDAVTGMEDRSTEVAGIGQASQNAAGTKAAVQANSQMLGEVVSELQALHLSLLSQERRELVTAARANDDEELARQQREAFRAGASTTASLAAVAVPVR
ncbi:hypothetical protein [Phycisphaera mikurensis]|uniref:Conjugal transfer protein TrbJ n=1 Tax=Phycisphaera mikurensis (strain NBRC 102666 / KCTC 22515 / FYK2301M01) TaxID=1142394 RepID=I0IJI9_PHYMF|nr:hypothetical protein [Phycisphaera mikurensis]MBB6443177.1 P-type conjugative transfer protein TrbJ [Phycisphaera mikurensis]BAM05427.1 hypothetical protein PSMK_p00650 [Phycisphaera mikurensis NBRC 102666]